MKMFATYLRVSTQKQGRSGLGLDAQRRMCADYIMANDAKQMDEFIDVESGTHRDRKGLQQAIVYCKQNGCGLVIAKLDRLCRDVEFCFKVVNTGIDIHFCDMPTINTLLLGVFASVAQYERELTSDRTKKALAVKKAQGEKLGGANERYKHNYELKTKEQKEKENMKRGTTKNMRHMESRDVQAFVKILRSVFPDACKEESPTKWIWSDINTKDGNRQRVLSMMLDYKDIDPSLFAKWKIDDVESNALHHKLASYIAALKKSVFRYNK